MTRPSDSATLDALLGQLAAQIAEAVGDHLADLVSSIGQQGAPPLLDRRGLAAALGVCAETVDKLRKEGLPTIMVVESPRFDLAECVDWLKARRRQS